MEHVALYKERTNSPTEDIEREAVGVNGRS